MNRITLIGLLFLTLQSCSGIVTLNGTINDNQGNKIEHAKVKLYDLPSAEKSNNLEANHPVDSIFLSNEVGEFSTKSKLIPLSFGIPDYKIGIYKEGYCPKIIEINKSNRNETLNIILDKDSTCFNTKDVSKNRVKLISRISKENATKEGIYINGFVVHMDYSDILKYDNKTVSIEGEFKTLKGVNANKTSQGRSDDTRHIDNPYIIVLE